MANVKHIHTRLYNGIKLFILYVNQEEVPGIVSCSIQLQAHSGHTSKTFSTFARPLLSLYYAGKQRKDNDEFVMGVCTCMCCTILVKACERGREAYYAIVMLLGELSIYLYEYRRYLVQKSVFI